MRVSEVLWLYSAGMNQFWKPKPEILLRIETGEVVNVVVTDQDFRFLYV